MVSNDERSRKVARNASAVLLGSVAGTIVSIVTVPITLAALGNSGYGSLQTMTALGGVVALGDLGLGLAMRTRVGKLAGAGKYEEMRGVIGEAIVTLAGLAALVIAAGAALLSVVDVATFFNLPPALREQGTTTLAIAILAFALTMPLSVLTAAHYGLQLRDRLIGWYAGGNSLASLAGAATAHFTHRIDATLAVQSVVNLAATFGAVVMGCRIERSTIPRFALPKAREVVRLVRSGIAYYAFQAELVVIAGLDNIVIARVVGVEAVASYSVAYRLIRLAFSFVNSIGDSFWNGVAHAIGSGDLAWIRGEAVRLRRIATVAMTILVSGFVATAVPVIEIWTRGRIHASPWLTLALGLYFALSGHTMIDGAILAGAGRMRPVLAVLGGEAVLNLVASVVLAKRFGYVGVGYGTLLGYIVCDFIPLQLASSRVIALPGAAPSSRVRFWTRQLSAVVGSTAASFAAYELISPHLQAEPLVVAAVLGAASLGLSVALTRFIGGSDSMAALATLVRRVRRAPAS